MNKTGSAMKVKLNSFDDLFGIEQPQSGIEQVQEIELTELHGFKEHPFKVLDDENLFPKGETVVVKNNAAAAIKSATIHDKTQISVHR